MICMLSSADSVSEQASGEDLVERGVRGQSPYQSTLMMGRNKLDALGLFKSTNQILTPYHTSILQYDIKKEITVLTWSGQLI